MDKAFAISFNEKTGQWEKHEPFITIEVPTEEDFNELKAAVDHYQKRAHWILKDNQGNAVCSNCNKQDRVDPLAPYCRYCGLKLETKR